MNKEKQLTQKIQIISKEIIAGARKQLPDIIDKIILYGSYARGDYTSESDVDIMVLLNCPADDIPEYRKKTNLISSRISLENNIVISITLQDIHTFNYWLEAEVFYQNVKKEGIVLYGQA